jgi:hypothetical protein
MLKAAKISQNDLILFPIFQTLLHKLKPIQILLAHSRPTGVTFFEGRALVAGVGSSFRPRSRSLGILKTAKRLNPRTE